MQDAEYGLPRTLLPRTPLNKDKWRKGKVASRGLQQVGPLRLRNRAVLTPKHLHLNRPTQAQLYYEIDIMVLVSPEVYHVFRINACAGDRDLKA